MLGFKVHSPLDLSQALETAQTLAAPVYYLAGGTDIVPKAQNGLLPPGNLIDLSKIAELKTIEEREDNLFIGSLATHSQIQESPLLRRYAEVLSQSCGEVGSPQIRNLGTIGGNCANASPAGDSIPALYVLEAKIHLTGAQNSERTLPIEQFFLGPGKTVLNKGEIISGFSIPKNSQRRGIFLKIGQRKALAISKVSLAFCARIEEQKYRGVRIALGSVAPTVIRVPKVEEMLEGQSFSLELAAGVKAQIIAAARPIDDIRSLAAYRSAMTGVLLEKALTVIKAG